MTITLLTDVKHDISSEWHLRWRHYEAHSINRDNKSEDCLWISMGEKYHCSRGVLKLVFDGVCGTRSETLPISKDFSTSKTADFTVFFFFFFFRNFREMGPTSKDLFWQKWDPCLRIFWEKLTHFCSTSS